MMYTVVKAESTLLKDLL